jgi:broad specificity phosphatase PhoE
VKIVLVRHGPPAAVPAAWSAITGHEIGAFVREYNLLGTAATAPPPQVSALAASCSCIMSSNLPRAIESAQLIGRSQPIQIDAELREAALPERIDLSMRLPVAAWTALARIVWWLNWASADESRSDARARASLVADRLSAAAHIHKGVLAVGHGIFNRLIARELKRRGWRGRTILARSYWECATLTIT